MGDGDFVVVAQSWSEHDRWSGPDHFGYTIHLTETDRKAYLKAFYVDRPSRAPEYYIQEEGLPFQVYISKRLFDDLLASENGVRVFPNQIDPREFVKK